MPEVDKIKEYDIWTLKTALDFVKIVATCYAHFTNSPCQALPYKLNLDF